MDITDQVAQATAVLVENSIKLLQSLHLDKEKGAYVGTSGGKDSVLITHLTEMAYPCWDFPLVHTTKPHETHPETLKFLYSMHRSIIYTTKELHYTFNFTHQVDGTRIAEATRNDGRSTDFISNGKSYSRTELQFFVPNGLFGLNFVYPIFDWSDDEVWTAIKLLDIKVSPEYKEEIQKWNL